MHALILLQSEYNPDFILTLILSVCPGPVYLITEFCRHGDLVNYLQRNKHTFLQSDTHTKRSAHTKVFHVKCVCTVRHVLSLCLSVSVLSECLSPCSDSDGGYMDMNKEESVQYVAMQQLSYADIEPTVYEATYTPPGDDGGVTSMSWFRPPPLFSSQSVTYSLCLPPPLCRPLLSIIILSITEGVYWAQIQGPGVSVSCLKEPLK